MKKIIIFIIKKKLQPIEKDIKIILLQFEK